MAGKENKPALLSSLGDEASLAGTSPILAVFKKAAKDLLERHDRHERINKLSRDININSKRIITLLQTSVTDEMKDVVVPKAKQRIQELINGDIKRVALQMENVSAYLHHKVITAGLQEYVEARTFLSVIEHGKVVSYTDVKNELTYTIQSKDGHEKVISTLITPQDYILGLADLGGEMMKRAISRLSTGSVDQCFADCEMLQELYTGFLGLSGINPTINNKLATANSNVTKVERALYAYMVRGSEVIPKLDLEPPSSNAAGDQSIEEDGLLLKNTYYI